MRNLPLLVRFWSKVDKTPGFGPRGDCWRWTGTKVSGRGQIMVDGKKMYAPRVSFEMHKGPIPIVDNPFDACICHTCDIGECTNPDHLFLGTQGDNVLDCQRKNRRVTGSQVSLSVRGEKNGHARLRPDQVLAIRKDWRPLQDIADDYDIAKATASAIRLRKIWKHLQEPNQ